MGSSWTRVRQGEAASSPKQPVICISTQLQWRPQQCAMDCGLACAQMVLRTLDGAGRCPQPMALLVLGDRPSPSDEDSSESSGESVDVCNCSICSLSCLSPDDSEAGEQVDERRGPAESSAAELSSGSSPASGSGTVTGRGDKGAVSDQPPVAVCCVCTQQWLQTEHGPCPSPCLPEKSLFGSRLSPASEAFCEHQATELAQRVARGSWTVDLLLLLQHLPRVSRASLAWEVLSGRVAIVLVDEGRLIARDPNKVPSHEYDGHFVVVCGVALAYPVANADGNSWREEPSVPEGYSKQAGLPPGSKTAERKPLSEHSVFKVDAAQRSFSEGVRACQVKAFLLLDPLHSKPYWITPERLDFSRSADGTDDDLLLIQMPSHIQNAWFMDSAPACSR
ncbi:hypothetical protein Efla_005847 [Eimeria flavescens]